MKTSRQNEILRILESCDIENQKELVEALLKEGIKVTQATISRDIRQLRLVKVLSATGRYVYALPNQGGGSGAQVPIRVFSDTVTRIESAGTLVVIHTLTGSASAAAEALDALRLPEIAGSIAGDNTIFIAARDGFPAQELARRLRGFME